MENQEDSQLDFFAVVAILCIYLEILETFGKHISVLYQNLLPTIILGQTARTQSDVDSRGIMADYTEETEKARCKVNENDIKQFPLIYHLGDTRPLWP